MTTKTISVKEAVRRLNTIPRSPALVRLFERTGCTGNKKEESSCPIANWLTHRTGCTVRVDADSVLDLDNDTYYSGTFIDLSPAAKAFIENFDAGEYPQLISG